ncbi:MAG: hypothetical protein PSV22_14635, partial [Pseudolabrys sp.]|nr:hypothetical protein [Pseudolabrys sp.]
IAELRAEFNASAKISLGYMQEKLLGFANCDITRYFEHTAGGRLKLRDVTQLPPELRSALSELRVDAKGAVVVKMVDKLGAYNSLIKTIGGFAPERIEVTGANGGPVETLDVPTEIEAARRLAWMVQATLRDLTGDPQMQAYVAGGIRTAVNAVLGGSESDPVGLEIAAMLPPIEGAREALIAIATFAKRVVSDREAATFTASHLRQIADAIEGDAALTIEGATPAGAS